MHSTTVLLTIAVRSHCVQAHNETLIHGWKPEVSGRGTWSILWSCLATIFICTWSAQHLDVPTRPGRPYRQFFRKISWMLIAALAPEVVLYNAADNFFQAWSLVKHLKKRGRTDWTLTHAQFIYAKGFRISRADNNAIHHDPWDPDELRKLIEEDVIGQPPLSEDELKSRGKSDWVIKLIAVLQTLWFVIHSLFRAIQGYQTTPLEIMTVAFVFCSVFIYAFSMNQPQDVEYPVVINIGNGSTAKDEVSQRHTQDHRGNGSREKAPSDAEDVRETATPSRDIEHPKIDPLNLASEEPRVAPPSLVHGIRRSTPTTLSRRLTGPKISFIRNASDRPGHMKEVSQYVPGWATDFIPAVLFELFACGFGAIHCLGWNSPFPTSKEQLAWRICSASATGLPAVFALLVIGIFVLALVFGFVDADNDDDDMFLYVVVFPLIFLTFIPYVIARATSIVLAFMSLRALPADTFQTVDWNQYFPHFAA